MDSTSCFAKKCYQLMLYSRLTDNRITKMHKQGITPFQVTSNGHEALAAIGMALQNQDYLFPHYRDKALLLAKGMSIEQIARNALSKKNAECAGRNMSGHYSFKEKNIFSLASPVASQCLPAAGVAWSLKMNHSSDAIVACSVGDASCRQGEFYEAICFAVEKSLPILFVVEDNRYGISTSTLNQLPFRLNIYHHQLYTKLDARCAVHLNETIKTIIPKIRKNQSPHILWCNLDRIDSHASSDDQSLYREREEIENLIDPIIKMETYLLECGIYSQNDLTKIQNDSEQYVNDVLQRVCQEENPPSSEVKSNLYGPNVKNSNSFISLANNELNMVEAVNLSLSIALEEHPNMLLFGEDIEDPKGGVFWFYQKFK